MRTYTIALAAALSLAACDPTERAVESEAELLSELGGAGEMAEPMVIADAGAEFEVQLDDAPEIDLETVEFEDPRAAAFGGSDYDCCYTSLCRGIRDTVCPADRPVPITNGIGSVCCQRDIGQCEAFPDADAGV